MALVARPPMWAFMCNCRFGAEVCVEIVIPQTDINV